MSIINISDITVLSNPAKFTDPYLFRITFECMAPLEQDLEWKLIYVGSADSESFDQELDTCMVGPVPVGVNSFEFEAAAPLPSRIPSSDLIGVTVILLTCSYNEQEFVRVGYYVNTEYEEGELKDAHDRAIALTETEGAAAEERQQAEDDAEDQEEEEDEEGEGEGEGTDASEERKQRANVGSAAKEKEKEIVSTTTKETTIKAPDPSKHVDRLVRSVLGEKPRVTRFNIKWDVQDAALNSGINLDTSTVAASVFSPEMESLTASDGIPLPFDPYVVGAPSHVDL